MASFNYTGVEQMVKGVVKNVLPLFYLVPPSQSSFATLEEIPNYIAKVSGHSRSVVKCVSVLFLSYYTLDRTLFRASHLCGRDRSCSERTSQDSC